MTSTGDDNAHLAVLIDADNADPGTAQGLLAEISTFGVASVKRIYGDWTTPQLGRWKAALLDHSIQPIQQFAYTSGKNATDSAMIIDAMDLLYTGTFSGFCLVSSDSDFTRLASRIRESGKRVYGFGERKTPRPFVTACDQFIYTEIFKETGDAPSAPPSTKTGAELRSDARLVNQLRAAVAAGSGENGQASLGAVGNILLKQSPDFDPRLYGYAKLSDLFEAVGLFVVDRGPGGAYVSDARRKK
ncbi:OST-HTH/LOTUS domain-containing protein [Humibacillus xanthopallidus]|uniref:OST-HTH/LOTUS domain-containing protein n=1 Tax=Humibacillus xanthopallidus TaxID=412689 RepID=A0A543PMG1_9MICO|nr:NYN domain-containing protein [Humibacillus xanthopallidus]TQN45263.1 OST-HTH/LOTUS domain-containing protein [Humibacillus xanthopallidus]